MPPPMIASLGFMAAKPTASTRPLPGKTVADAVALRSGPDENDQLGQPNDSSCQTTGETR